MSDNPTGYAEKAAAAEDLILDTDYASAITRQWHKVVDELADARAAKADLGVQIKTLVAERQKLVPLVRLVSPSLLERDGDSDE